MKRLGRVDIGAYLRAFALLGRNPILIVAPLAGFLFSIILELLPVGGLLGGLLQILGLCGEAFGIAVSIIIADYAWRSAKGKASFDAGWVDAQRKAPDILLATLGFTFALSAALMVGGLTQSQMIALLFLAAALFFLIYTLPAAAIGGVPGSMALQASIERVQANKVNALVLTVVSAFIAVLCSDTGFIGLVVSSLTGSPRIGVLELPGMIVMALIKSVAAAYVSLLLAKGYSDAAFRRP